MPADESCRFKDGFRPSLPWVGTRKTWWRVCLTAAPSFVGHVLPLAGGDRVARSVALPIGGNAQGACPQSCPYSTFLRAARRLLSKRCLVRFSLARVESTIAIPVGVSGGLRNLPRCALVISSLVRFSSCDESKALKRFQPGGLLALVAGPKSERRVVPSQFPCGGWSGASRRLEPRLDL